MLLYGHYHRNIALEKQIYRHFFSKEAAKYITTITSSRDDWGNVLVIVSCVDSKHTQSSNKKAVTQTITSSSEGDEGKAASILPFSPAKLCFLFPPPLLVCRIHELFRASVRLLRRLLLFLSCFYSSRTRLLISCKNWIQQSWNRRIDHLLQQVAIGN